MVLRWLLSPPPPPPPNWVNVVVYNYPYDAPDHYISDALKFFGTIDKVRYQHWTNLPEIATGTRVVRMNLTRSIPRFMKIHTYRCKVWYRGQPVYCDICKAGTHLASNCPYKGKCLSCEGVGHLARNCPTVCFKCKGGHASDSCPNRRRWENVRTGDDDIQSVASGLGAGNDGGADPVESSADGVEASNVSAAGVASDGSASNPVPSFNFLAPRPPEVSSVSPQVSASPVDERLNQLDELQSQDESSSPSVLAGLSGVVNEACESAFGALDASANSTGSSAEDSFLRPHDVSMSESSSARKHELSETLSSDDARRSRSRNRKAARTPGPHLPSGVSAAANLARSWSSSSISRSSSLVKSSSKS